jgi:hypothetical protein
MGLIETLGADRAALVDDTGRTSTFEDNLLQTLKEVQVATLRPQLAAGDGAELTGAGDGRRPDAHAAHSSSALAFNAFGAWLGFESDLVIDGVAGFTDALRIEARQPIFRGGRAPNLDCLLTGPLVAAGIESKLTEPLAPHPSRSWSEAYGRASSRALLRDGWLETLDSARLGVYEPTYLDAAQLIKHALGLSRQHPDRDLHLIYVYWEPNDGDEIHEVLKHRREVAELLNRVGDSSPCLHALTYTQLWVQWDALTEVPWLPDHLAALRRRYAQPLTPNRHGQSPTA